MINKNTTKILLYENINNIYYNFVIGSGYTPKIEHFTHKYPQNG